MATQAIRQREWYERNRQEIIAKRLVNNKKLIQRNKDFVAAYLLAHPCVDCGEPDIIVLDFDHLDDKLEAVSNLVWNCASIKRIQTEIAKCEVVCANCHRRRTAKRRG